jgi:hypothetical protein
MPSCAFENLLAVGQELKSQPSFLTQEQGNMLPLTEVYGLSVSLR